MAIKAQCGLRCDVPTPHSYRLLATHYSLRAHSGTGVAEIKHVITSPLLWMAVGVVVGCYGWLRRRTVRRDHHGCRRRFAGRSPSPGCCSGCSRSRNFGLNSDLARFRIKVAIPIACVAAAVVSVVLIQDGTYTPMEGPWPTMGHPRPGI